MDSEAAKPTFRTRVIAAWTAVRTAYRWTAFHVFLKGREVPTPVAIRTLAFLRLSVLVLGGVFGALALLLWYDWGIARARALRLLVERQEASAYLAAKTYDHGREQIEQLMKKVDADATIASDEKIRRKGDLATMMMWVMARENASMNAYRAAARAKASIPSRIWDKSSIQDPVSGEVFALNASVDQMKNAMIPSVQDSEQAKAFINLIGIYSKPGAPAMPSKEDLLLGDFTVQAPSQPSDPASGQEPAGQGTAGGQP